MENTNYSKTNINNNYDNGEYWCDYVKRENHISYSEELELLIDMFDNIKISQKYTELKKNE